MVAIKWKPGFNLIMAYFKRKDCLQRNLYLKCVSLWKSLEGWLYRIVRLNKCSNLVECVNFSDLSGAFQWLEWSYCDYKFLRINNADLKCSFVRCRKYHKSWWNGAAELHISVDLLCGTTAAELYLLCGTAPAELHNSVDLLCGTTAAETFERWTFWKIQQTQIDSRPSANSWNMYALRRFSKLLKDERFTKTE